MTTRRKWSWQTDISKRRCLWIKVEIKTSYNFDWNRLMMNKVCFLHSRLWITSWHDQEINKTSSSILIFELENVLMNNSIKRKKIDDSTFKDDIHSNMSNDTKKTTTMIQTNKCRWQTFCEIKLIYESKDEYQYSDDAHSHKSFVLNQNNNEELKDDNVCKFNDNDTCSLNMID
jgi:hypothetical protein